MFLEYCRLAYRFFVPRAERSIAGEITAITGAGSGTRHSSYKTVENLLNAFFECHYYYRILKLFKDLEEWLEYMVRLPFWQNSNG
jgi:hypothetical protein